MMTNLSLDPLFSPRSIAIVGASKDPARIGGRPIQSSLNAGYSGKIYPVNPKYPEVMGLKCYPSVASLPEAVDLVVVALAAPYVQEVLADAAGAGARSMVVFSSGYAEVGDFGRIAQEELVVAAKAAEIAMLGPNCLGMINPAIGAVASFSAAFELGNIPVGRVGFACQSGAFGTYFLSLARQRSLGVHLWAATGNEAALGVAECIEYMVGIEEIEVIAGYVEGVQNSAALSRALEMAHSAQKPVVLLKAGRTKAGERAAMSHTGSAAGDDAVFSAVLERYGAFRAADLAELLDLVQACVLGGPMVGPRLCLMSVSGGAGILMADTAIEAGLELPEPSQLLQSELKSIVPYASVANPVDFTGQFLNDASIAGSFLERLCATSMYDGFVIFLGHTAAASSLAETSLTRIAELARQYSAKFFLVGFTSVPMAEMLRDAGVVIAADPSRVIALIAKLVELHGRLKAPAPLSPKQLGAATRARILGAIAKRTGGEHLQEAEVRELLASVGIAVVPAVRVDTPANAGRSATAIGFPVALKVVSPQVPYPSQAGGVRLGLGSAAAVESAAYEMIGKVAALVPGAHIEGFLVEPMIASGPEVNLVARRDPHYGPVVMVESKGGWVGAKPDNAIAIAPVSKDRALNLLARTHVGFSIISGRLHKGYSIGPLVEAVVNLSRLIAAIDRIEEVKLNGVLVRTNGEMPIALGASIALVDGSQSGVLNGSLYDPVARV